MLSVEHLVEDDYRTLLEFRTELRRFLHWSEQQAREAGLSPAQHQLLLAVRGYPDPKGPTVNEVAEHLVLRQNSAVELIDRAEAAGYVTRVPDPSDRADRAHPPHPRRPVGGWPVWPRPTSRSSAGWGRASTGWSPASTPVVSRHAMSDSRLGAVRGRRFDERRPQGLHLVEEPRTGHDLLGRREAR